MIIFLSLYKINTLFDIYYVINVLSNEFQIVDDPYTIQIDFINLPTKEYVLKDFEDVLI
ncbi:hypothetical protein HQ550_03690 [bacterium]|nr:hypothetical protein [bacterium]